VASSGLYSYIIKWNPIVSWFSSIVVSAKETSNDRRHRWLCWRLHQQDQQTLFKGQCCWMLKQRVTKKIGNNQGTRVTVVPALCTLLSWTHPFHAQTRSGFCACAISFYLQYTNIQTDWHIFMAQNRQVVAIFSQWRPVFNSGPINDGSAVDKVAPDRISPSTLALTSHCHSTSATYSYTHSYTIDDTQSR
jgi:hypothetical protein